jgi:hypothetical protein
MRHAHVAAARFTRAPNATTLSPPLAHILFLLALAAGLVAGFTLPDPASTARAIASAGPELTRLLRFMAAIKSLLVIGAASVILWRLKAPVSAGRFIAYASISALMAAGIGEIWQLTRIGLGAMMLHGALAAAVLLLWQDRVLHQQLATAVSRRAGLRRR